MSCTDVLADSRGNDADRTSTGYQNVFTHQVKLQGTVGGISEGVKKGSQFRCNLIGYGPEVGRRNDDIFGKRTVAVDTDTNRVWAQVTFSRPAIPAVTTNNMAFRRYTVTLL